MRLLALDPGVLTGVALLEDGKLVYSDALELEDLRRFLEGIRQIDYIVVERTPIPTLSALNRHLLDVTQTIRSILKVSREVPPGVWKNSFYGKTQIDRKFNTPHQEDAYRLALFSLDSLEVIPE